MFDRIIGEGEDDWLMTFAAGHSACHVLSSCMEHGCISRPLLMPRKQAMLHNFAGQSHHASLAELVELRLIDDHRSRGSSFSRLTARIARPVLVLEFVQAVHPFKLAAAMLVWYVITSLKMSAVLFTGVSFPYLSTGFRPSSDMPLWSTCLAASYSAIRASLSSGSLPTTLRTS